MAFCTLSVDSAAELHVQSGQLTVQRADDPKPLFIDLDDLACIVLANLDITLSAVSTALNYGDAVVRSTIARAVVSHGFITSVGLHHANDRNKFNLVDDLIEPFRPMVDLQMLKLDLDTEDPAHLSRGPESA